MSEFVFLCEACGGEMEVRNEDLNETGNQIKCDFTYAHCRLCKSMYTLIHWYKQQKDREMTEEEEEYWKNCNCGPMIKSAKKR